MFKNDKTYILKTIYLKYLVALVFSKKYIYTVLLKK